jgi:hypothetical protein
MAALWAQASLLEKLVVLMDEIYVGTFWILECGWLRERGAGP